VTHVSTLVAAVQFLAAVFVAQVGLQGLQVVGLAAIRLEHAADGGAGVHSTGVQGVADFTAHKVLLILQFGAFDFQLGFLTLALDHGLLVAQTGPVVAAQGALVSTQH